MVISTYSPKIKKGLKILKKTIVYIIITLTLISAIMNKPSTGVPNWHFFDVVSATRELPIEQWVPNVKTKIEMASENSPSIAGLLKNFDTSEKNCDSTVTTTEQSKIQTNSKEVLTQVNENVSSLEDISNQSIEVKTPATRNRSIKKRKKRFKVKTFRELEEEFRDENSKEFTEEIPYFRNPIRSPIRIPVK